MRTVLGSLFILILANSALALEPNVLNGIDGSIQPKVEKKDWFERHEEGWWYKKEQKVKKPTEPVDEELPIDSLYPQLIEKIDNPIERLELLQQELEKAQALAVLQPTPENVEQFHRINRMIQDKSEYFADVWRRVVWQNPSLDPGIHRPSGGKGTFAWATSFNKTKENHLSMMADSHALVYFFKRDCPYCQVQSPIIKMLAERHGFHVRAMSLDGLVTHDWPRAEYSPALNNEFNVEYVPALFLVEPNTKSIEAISYGLVSLNEIEDRIYTLTKMPAGQMTYSPYKDVSYE